MKKQKSGQDCAKEILLDDSVECDCIKCLERGLNDD